MLFCRKKRPNSRKKYGLGNRNKRWKTGKCIIKLMRFNVFVEEKSGIIGNQMYARAKLCRVLWTVGRR